ncbi:hypothetical protein C8R47DRAFT_1217936 [Mycena vitilis]|nr:hypothetical protein C8R47DRAFT_1217936 [Mycena vitilis]
MSDRFSDTSFSPLQKGQACVNCRRRKTKCDGAKPMCGPCSRYSVAFGDCEYTEDGLSTAQMLEKQISVLQKRIDQLELSKNSRLRIAIPQASRSRPRSTSPPSKSSQVSPTNTMALGPLLSHFHRQQTSGTLNAALSVPTELPFIVLQALVHNFLHNANCFGFFLDTHAFHDAVARSDHSTLPPVLLNVMYLWGVHLSNDARIRAYEPAFLTHALRSTAGSLSGAHPRTVLHSVQASVLLAHYFLRNARALEGRYHISAAVATVLSAGLHTIRGRSSCPDPLPTTGDLAEEGERIRAFWRVLTLNNCWAGVDGSASNVSYGPNGLNIDTPWPLEVHEVRFIDQPFSRALINRPRGSPFQRPHMLPCQSGGTVARFLANESDDANSVPALHAKAGVLLEAATRLAGRFRASGISQNEDALVALTGRIDSFAAALPPVQSKNMLVVHTIVHGANIRLHEPLANDHLCARSNVLSAARAIVDILVKTDIPKLGAIDPVLASLWTCACNVFIAELVRRRAHGEPTQGITDGLQVVIATMQHLAGDFRLMGTSYI